MRTFTGSAVLSFVWPFLLLPKIRAWRLVMAYSSSGSASFFDRIVRTRDYVAFTIVSAGLTVGVFIA